MGDEFELDDLDYKIIAQLQDDGRKQSTEIARVLNVPRTTVARRIDRLVKENVITIAAFAHGDRIGLPIQVMIEIWTDNARHEAVINELIALDEIRWLGVASGPFDILAEAMVRSNRHLRQLLLVKLGGIEGISQIRTAHILEVRKFAFDWERMRQVGVEADRAELDEAPGQTKSIPR
ncbi:MAG TPA: Lrp/AsnC family transcriptional regulator [Nitrolancea sp.]|nr:Lrp/AsnC family transcriptional regulator [Nitrolancea sp.]